MVGIAAEPLSGAHTHEEALVQVGKVPGFGDSTCAAGHAPASADTRAQ